MMDGSVYGGEWERDVVGGRADVRKNLADGDVVTNLICDTL